MSAADDLQVAQRAEAERQHRVQHGPGLIALRRRRFVQAGPRRQVEAGADDEDAADAAGRLERFQHAEAEMDDVPGLDRRVGAEAAMPIQLGDGGGGGGVPLRDELLLVEEAHHPQVLGGDPGGARRRIRIRRVEQRPEVDQPRVAARRPHAPQQRGDARRHLRRDRRRGRRVAAQERGASAGVEALHQAPRAERRLDGRRAGDPRRLEQVVDQVVEVALAHALHVLGADAGDVAVEGGLADAAGAQRRLHRRDVTPADAGRLGLWRGGENRGERGDDGGDDCGEAKGRSGSHDAPRPYQT